MAVLPDVLGSITQNARVAVGVAQVALGVRPRMITAGQPFEVILLVQNCADVRVDVTAVLHLPKGFKAKAARLVVGLAAAEVGYVALPVMAAPDTPVGSQHKIGVEVDAKPLEKPGRARDASGGAPFDSASLSASRVRQLESLKTVAYSTGKRLGRTIIDAPVQVAAGAAGSGDPMSTGWVSLWTMGDIHDDGLLVERYRDLFRFRVLPQLTRDKTLKPLTDATQAQFAAANYSLEPEEALMVAKVMALILEYGAPTENSHNPITAGHYNLTPLLSGSADQRVPHWASAMLRTIARDERAAGNAVAAVVRLLYIDLLRDAISLAFTLVETATGEDVGSEQEMQEYAGRLLACLTETRDIDFVRAYMPLVLGGIIINDQITAPQDNFIEALRRLWVVLDQRRSETGDEGEPVIEIAEQLIERALQTYGYRRGST